MNFSARRTRQFYAWHKWTGLFAGLFIFVISLSGVVAVFKEDLDWLLTPAKRVAPAGRRASFDEVLGGVRQQYPEGTITNVRFPPDARTAYTIGVERKGADRVEVFVDPHTGHVTGARTGETAANVIRQLHVRFYYFGAWGRVMIGVFGVLLFVSTLTGLFIYWRFMKAVFAQGLRFWQVRQGRGLQVSSSDWHKLVGMVALVFNFVIALTGAVLGLENLSRYAPAVDRALHPRPVLQTKQPQPHQLPSTEGPALIAEEALSRARLALPGFEPTSMSPPAAGKNHFVFHGNVRGRFERAGASFVVIAAGGGATLDIHDAAQARASTRAYNLNEPLHFGDFGGLPLKLVYCLFGLTTPFLSITGFVIYALKRRRHRASRRAANAGSPAGRGELQR
ncbi:MAG: PepSY-associated TM helix domain-containing protein, partial [Pyrinomonadaceae bacterium]